MPKHVDGVLDEALNPHHTWADPEAYDAQARKLVEMFARNFEQFKNTVTEVVQAAGAQR